MSAAALLPILLLALQDAKPAAKPSREELVRTAVSQLIAIQEHGEWPYEGVYRVRGEIPVGYRVGGTSLVAGALLAAADPKDEQARAAIDAGLAFVLGTLDDPLLAPSTAEAYDVRVWGHACALDLLCALRAADRLGEHRAEAERWIKTLVATLQTEELDGGGWNYATRKEAATFVTAPVAQALLGALAQGEKVDEAVLARARDVLTSQRGTEGGYVYSGRIKQSSNESGAGARSVRESLPGAAARMPACEATLWLLGAGSRQRLALAIDNFHAHWSDLEKRRKQTGTHEPPYGIAPYYFYYGHRYAAEAIELLPPEAREKERDRLLDRLLATRDDDGTWNDRVFARTRNYGTSMAVLALLAEHTPIPPAWPGPKTEPAGATKDTPAPPAKQ